MGFAANINRGASYLSPRAKSLSSLVNRKKQDWWPNHPLLALARLIGRSVVKKINFCAIGERNSPSTLGEYATYTRNSLSKRVCYKDGDCCHRAYKQQPNFKNGVIHGKSNA